MKSLLAAGRILSFDFLLTYLTGVNTFLCLQTESELQRFNPYKQLAQSLNPDVEFLHLPIPGWVLIVSSPVLITLSADQSVTSDDKVIGMVEEVYQRLKSNKIIYVHCWGGHGRTGISFCQSCHYWHANRNSGGLYSRYTAHVILLLKVTTARVYKLDGDTALKYTAVCNSNIK